MYDVKMPILDNSVQKVIAEFIPFTKNEKQSINNCKPKSKTFARY